MHQSHAAAGRRRPHAVNMVQTVVGDIGDHLRSDMLPRVQRSGQDIWYVAVVHIRDGIVKYMTLHCWHNEQSNTPAEQPDALSDLINRAENWLFRVLPPRLVQGYHGEVQVELSMQSGRFVFVPHLIQQKDYQWFSLNGNGRQ